MRILQVAFVVVALLASVVLAGGQRASVALPASGALPSAGTDRLPVVATVDITSRVGDESVTFNGWVEVDREAPHDEGGVQVVDMEIARMELVGPSSVGAISAGVPTQIGPNGPFAESADSGGDGDGFEATPTNAFRNDSALASDTNSGTTTSTDCADAGKDRHRFSAFSAELPPAAVIEGIDVRLDARADSTSGSPFMCVELSWDGGNTWTAAQTTGTLPTSTGPSTLGGATDTWGHSWTPDELTNANFVLRVTNVASDNQRDFALEFVGVTVNYSGRSAGEIRSKQAGTDFPASSLVDLYVAIEVPITFPGGDTIVIHNRSPLRLVPNANLEAWPPLGVTYELEPIYNVDNDNDGQTDEDTADDDGDGLIDEDRPGPDPDTPGAGFECPPERGGADCDDQEGEDPPLSWCIANSSTICDNDGDGQMDEDPSCIPLMNAGNVNNMKAGFCVRNITLEFAPELPSYSVAAGGPSGYHPADIHALTPGTGFGMTSASGSSPTGNDDFADAWPIPALPFTGTQSTVGATTESGEPLNPGGNCIIVGPNIKGATVWYQFTPTQSGTVTVDTVGSDYDTTVAAFTGSVLSSLTVEACNDDDIGLRSRISFSVTSGTTYHVKAGGYNASSGNLVLNVYFPGDPTPTPTPTPPPPPDGTQAPFVRIPCASLGLTAEGCDIAGGVDDLNALSYGGDLPAGGKVQVNFSVGPGAQGVPGSAVRVQRDCAAPEPEPDEFSTVFVGTNAHVMDGNGPIGACSPAFPLGLLESSASRDDLDAVYGQDPAVVDADMDGVPESPVYFSLDPASPSLSGLGFSSGDVLKTVNGATPTVYASAADLGLSTSDDLDGLCLQESGDGAYGFGDVVYFTLAAGSPALATISAGPGDILAPSFPPIVVQNAASMGLEAADDVNAIKCLGLSSPKDPDGDTDQDTIPNSSDPDDDNDGCTDVEEGGTDPAQGGRRDAHNFWDVFFVWSGSPAVRDLSVTIGDIQAVVQRFGSFVNPLPTEKELFAEALTSPPPAPAYHASFDRGGPVPGQNVWNLRSPDGSVTIIDIVGIVGQFGHTCG